MKKLIVLGVLGLILAGTAGMGGSVVSKADAATAVHAGNDSASEVTAGCYRVTCRHIIRTRCVHRFRIVVRCYCHPCNWHYELRTRHIADLSRAHAWDWVCHCGRHFSR